MVDSLLQATASKTGNMHSDKRSTYRKPASPPQVLLSSHSDSTIIQKVIGVTSTIHDSIEQFRGIPYATAPDRWQPAILATSLPQDIFDASRHGPKCTQPSDSNNTGLYQSHLEFPDVGESEFQCLNLFITRPSLSALAKIGIAADHLLPVYFYIHGGGFGFGAGTDPIWDPTRMVMRSLELKTPILVVNINYRLNLFGFAASSSLLSSQSDTYPKGCNFGIRDQRIALEWTRQNISSFGGNPDNIVLGGQSAGGCSVHCLVLDAKLNPSTPPFKRAIIQSGAFACDGLAPVSMDVSDEKWRSLVKYFDLQNLPEAEQLEALRLVAGHRLVKASKDLRWQVFRLVNDGVTIKQDSDNHWHLDLGVGLNSDIPQQEDSPAEPIQILIGDTASEGSPFIISALPKLQTYQSILTIFEPCFRTPSDATEVLSTYNIHPNSSLASLHTGLNELISHTMFSHAVRDAHRELSQSNNRLFKHPSTAQLYKVKFGNPFPGPFHGNAHHCVDLIYQFDAFHDALVAQDEEDSREGYIGVSNMKLVEQVQDYWIEFIVGAVGVEDEEVVVAFEEDRTLTREKMDESPYWVDQNRKLDVLGRYKTEIAELKWKLFALGRS